jgi:hypothetical protein
MLYGILAEPAYTVSRQPFGARPNESSPRKHAKRRTIDVFAHLLGLPETGSME